MLAELTAQDEEHALLLITSPSGAQDSARLAGSLATVAATSGLLPMALVDLRAAPGKELEPSHEQRGYVNVDSCLQEVHIEIVHSLIELIERQLFPGNYSGKESS